MMARSNKVSLSVRQQPLQALVTAEHKEKGQFDKDCYKERQIVLRNLVLTYG